jgi:hypothetical protein
MRAEDFETHEVFKAPPPPPTKGHALYYDGTTYWELNLSADRRSLVLTSEVDGEVYLVIPVDACRTSEGAPLIPVEPGS